MRNNGMKIIRCECNVYGERQIMCSNPDDCHYADHQE